MAILDKNIASETFWLNIAAENIYSSFEKRATSVKNLKEIIAWAFGLFATTGFVGSVFGTSIKSFNDTSLWCFAIAFFLLTIAYVLAGQAQYPVTKEYHPNDVSDISKVFGEAVKTQSFYFKSAAATTMVGFFFVALAILFLFSHAKQEPPKPLEVAINPLLLKAKSEIREGKHFIPVTAMAIRDSAIDLSISGIKDGKATVIYNQPLRADSIGRMHFSYADTIKIKYDSFLVRTDILQKTPGEVSGRFTSVIVVRKK